MQPPLGKKTKGCQCRENRLVEDRESRQVTFSKRKSGLWKKASELALLCRASLTVIVFSEAGKGFAFGSPSTDDVLAYAGYGNTNAHPAATDDVEWEALEALCRETEKKGVEVAAEAARMSAVGKKVVDVQTQVGRWFWWEADVEALDEAELPEFARVLQHLRDNVRRRADNLVSALPPQ
ncbi:agamous-like MADS-box protein AGL61 [Triticum urartu]|uniref:agamous-like MADS-box protein AGL61 n=1 Tax=Triticum urartu TaxID=4572 RepID=UPI0020437BBD|nr:agamous-like MADS-box protein AGL61 [Triticum urartu]